MDKLIVFDLDGTLIDSIGGIANSVNRTREKFGAAPLDKTVIQSYVGNGIKKLMERASTDFQTAIPMDEIVATATGFYADAPLVDTHLYPGVLETMQKLRTNGFRLCVVSNKPQLISDKIIAGLGIADLLDFNIGGGAGFPLKPAPDAIEFLLKKFDIQPADAFVVGDNYTDLAAAENAGVRSIFCRFGFGEKQDFSADMEIDTFAELINCLL